MTKTRMNERRWRVDFHELAYDGGGSSSWSWWYRTKIGAYLSMYWNVYVASWGGGATLYNNATNKLLHRIDH